jgi:hypothetical protein
MLRDALNLLPESLDETYARILRGFKKEYRPDAIRLLQFLVYSDRPLTIYEAVDAIAVDLSGDARFDPEMRMPIPQEISQICSSLVSLVTKMDKESGQPTSVELHLAHFSVKEYLMSERVEDTFRGSMNCLNARATITQACLAYLSHIGEHHPVQDISELFPLALYSAQYWMSHAKDAETEDVLTNILHFFCEEEEAYTEWGCLFRPDQPWIGTRNLIPDDMAAPLYYASFAGLVGTVQLLLENGANVSAQGGKYGNALQAACEGGYEKIVQILIDQGANVNAQAGSYGNALQAASFEGHEKIVQILIHQGADVNAQGGRHGNALQAASFEGHEKIVQILIDQGADVNAQAGDYANALQAACEGGYEKIVQILIHQGADVNAQGGRHGNNLQAA